jgi:hypothetical protein
VHVSNPPDARQSLKDLRVLELDDRSLETDGGVSGSPKRPTSKGRCREVVPANEACAATCLNRLSLTILAS